MQKVGGGGDSDDGDYQDVSLGDETENNNNNNNNLGRNFAYVLWLSMGRTLVYFELILTVITETLYPDSCSWIGCQFVAGLSGKRIEKHKRSIPYYG